MEYDTLGTKPAEVAETPEPVGIPNPAYIYTPKTSHNKNKTQNAPVPKPDPYWGVVIPGAVMSGSCIGILGLPFGIIAITKAAKVNGLYNARLYDAAYKASRDAKMWGTIALTIAIVSWSLYLVFIIASKLIQV